MNSCPNIARGEVRKRLYIGYVGLFGTIITIMFTVFFNQDHLRFLIFFPAILTTVTFFEALDKTCIVYAYLGIKNMGDKYHKERESDSLKVQRIQSIKIVVKSIISAIIITAAAYIIWSRNLL